MTGPPKTQPERPKLSRYDWKTRDMKAALGKPMTLSPRSMVQWKINYYINEKKPILEIPVFD